MGYVGNQTTTAFTSMAKQDITGNGGTGYTLDHAVANAQEIEVFVNNVRQEPGVAYTVSGTALTMTGNVASTDDFYVVYQGKAVQTATHPATQPLSATTGTFSGDLTVDTNTLKVDSTNNRVGIGKTPTYTLDIHGVTAIKDSESLTWQGGSQFSSAIVGSGSNNRLQFWTSANQRMIIDSGGSVRINTTSNQIGSGEGLSVNVGGGGVGASFVGTATDTMSVWQKSSGGGTAISFYSTTSATNTGRISLSASATSYITSSDHRMKQGVEDMTGAIDRVKALAPKRFQFIADADTTVDGFLAHEAQAVVPEAVSGTHNEVDDDGNAVMQGIDQSKLVPLLTAALKESIAKIETLEAKVAALEAADGTE